MALRLLYVLEILLFAIPFTISKEKKILIYVESLSIIEVML